MGWVDQTGAPVDLDGQRRPGRPTTIRRSASAAAALVNQLSSGEEREHDLSERIVRERELARTESLEKEGQPLPTPAKVAEGEKSRLQAPELEAAVEAKGNSALDNPRDGEGDQPLLKGEDDNSLHSDTAGDEENEARDDYETDQVYGNVGHHREDSKRRSPRKYPVKRDESPRQEARRQARQQQEEKWQYLCHVDAIKDYGGASPERLWFLGAIQGWKPGAREGLPYEFCLSRKARTYLLTIETTERVLLDLLGGHKDLAWIKIQHGGLAAAKVMREEWSDLLAELVAETRPGQLSELYRRTERMFVHWEETMVPGYTARQLSLDEAVAESEHECETRFAKRGQGAIREKKAGKCGRMGESRDSRLFQCDEAVGPLKTDPSGREGILRTKSRRREKARDVSPLPDTRDDEEARWRAREADFFARIEGLLAAQAAAQLQGPPTKPVNERKEVRRDMQKSLDGDLSGRLAQDRIATSTHRKTEGERETSARQPGSFVNPVVRRYYESRFVTAVEEVKSEGANTR